MRLRNGPRSTTRGWLLKAGWGTTSSLARALDRLFAADRATLQTHIVLAAMKHFSLKMDQIHNDTTSVTVRGAYDGQNTKAVQLNLARHNPLAIIPVAILLGGIGASGGLLQRRLGLPDASVLVLQGIIFVTVLASDCLYGRFGFFARKDS
jgi:hypothetical protein